MRNEYVIAVKKSYPEEPGKVWFEYYHATLCGGREWWQPLYRAGIYTNKALALREAKRLGATAYKVIYTASGQRLRLVKR
jgi:hypothetical protein